MYKRKSIFQSLDIDIRKIKHDVRISQCIQCSNYYQKCYPNFIFHDRCRGINPYLLSIFRIGLFVKYIKIYSYVFFVCSCPYCLLNETTIKYIDSLVFCQIVSYWKTLDWLFYKNLFASGIFSWVLLHHTYVKNLGKKV